MNLTGKELIAAKIITGRIVPDNIQQHGVDLNLIKVEKIQGPGFIPVAGKTVLAKRIFIQPEEMIAPGTTIPILAWQLEPGAYDITFEQGCNIPADQRLQIVQRSSGIRNALIVRSALFDAGFTTSHIGTVMIVHEPINIEVGARIAQIYATTSNLVENLYNGQWQGDAQRVNS